MPRSSAWSPCSSVLPGFVPFVALPKGLGDDLDVLADGLHVGLPPRDLGLRRGVVNLDHHLSVQLEPLDVAPALVNGLPHGARRET